jgi:Rrf2 family nitric oxide-sensitive transcriptional repressor
MRLTDYTDYALRTLMYLGVHADSTATIQEIADAYGVSKNHLMKVVHEFGQAGYIETSRGRGGGIRLGRPASEISVGDVVRLAEGEFTLVECFGADHNQCVITPVCRLKGVLRRALDAYMTELDRYSLADLIENRSALVRLLPRD